MHTQLHDTHMARYCVGQLVSDPDPKPPPCQLVSDPDPKPPAQIAFSIARYTGSDIRAG